MSLLRIAFLGQNVSDSLELLKAIHNNVGLVAIVESAPRGFDVSRYGNIFNAENKRRSKLMRLARKEKLPYFLLTSSRITELADFISEHEINLMCVASMSGLLREPALCAPKLGMIGYHPSLLPKYRGPNPWFWQYYFMEREGGVSIFFLDAMEDTGDIAYQESFPIVPGLPFVGLHQKCIEVGTRLMIQTVEAISLNRCPRMAQKHLLCPFRARGISKCEALIQWEEWPLLRVWHVLRGTAKWLDAVRSDQLPWGRPWHVGDMVPTPSTIRAGEVGKDAEGFFIAHREGRIRIVY